MDFRTDSFEQQLQQLATVYERVEEKKKKKGMSLEENAMASH